MKKYITILLLTLLPLFYSCIGKNDQADFTAVSPAISAVNNGVNWSAFLTDTIANDSLVLYAQTKLSLLRIKVPIATTAPGYTRR